jgi:PLD-like domain/CYTH domain
MIALQAARSASEREVKLAAAPSFRMPPLDGLADGVQLVPREPQQLSTTYFDTEDLRLARWGVNVRHRLGEGWTVKLSAQSDGALLVRPELVFAGHSRRPPAPAVDLVRAFVRSAELRPQARLRTVRRGIELQDAEGRLVAEVLEDEVSVLEGRRLATRFRELEVEIRDESPPALLDRLVERLRQAGAGVRILEHPAMLHAKAFLRDGEELLAGTCNLEAWSLKRFFEIDVQVWSRAVAVHFEERFATPAEAASAPGRALDGMKARAKAAAFAALSPFL